MRYVGFRGIGYVLNGIYLSVYLVGWKKKFKKDK